MMISTTPPVSGTGGDAPATKAAWRSVAIPSEHGGWSLTLEPAILGLIVAWSWPGLALGVAALVAFMARTPVKLVLVDRWRDRRLERTRLAGRLAALELSVLVVLVALIEVSSADARFWVPLVVAAPFVTLELWYDMRSRSRRLIPELAGAIGIGSVAAAIALADGTSTAVSYGLWVVIAARSVAAIPYVRTQILRYRAKPSHAWVSDLAQIIAVGGVSVAWVADLVPLASAIAMAVLALVNLIAVRRPPQRAVVVGVQQTVCGVAVITTTAIAVLAT